MFNKKPNKVNEQEAEALAEAVNKFKEFQDNVKPEEVKELKELSAEQADIVHQLTLKSDREVEVQAPLKRERGDLVKYEGLNYRIVEVIEAQRYHVKNLVEPFNSFIVLENELD